MLQLKLDLLKLVRDGCHLGFPLHLVLIERQFADRHGGLLGPCPLQSEDLFLLLFLLLSLLEMRLVGCSFEDLDGCRLKLLVFLRPVAALEHVLDRSSLWLLVLF